MLGVQKVASGSPPEAAPRAAKRLGFPATRRLRKAHDFDSLARTRPAFRATCSWLALVTRIEPAGHETRVRIGVTVGKRFARKSVQRSMVKRVLRESARHALPLLEAVGRRYQVDAVLRLRADFPSAEAMSLVAFRRALRADADELLGRLLQHLKKTGATT